MIGGIIMAAGLSERMGGTVPKQLLSYRGSPFVAVVAATAAASRIEEVVVVTGHRGDEVAAAVADIEVVVAPNPDYRQGNMTSFVAGYRALPECDAYVILLADMPEVDQGTVDRMIAYWVGHRPWAAMAGYSDGRGHPLLLSAAAMELAAAEAGPRAVWQLLDAAPPDQVAIVDIDRAMPHDINTASEFEQLPE